MVTFIFKTTGFALKCTYFCSTHLKHFILGEFWNPFQLTWFFSRPCVIKKEIFRDINSSPSLSEWQGQMNQSREQITFNIRLKSRLFALFLISNPNTNLRYHQFTPTSFAFWLSSLLMIIIPITVYTFPFPTPHYPQLVSSDKPFFKMFEFKLSIVHS